MKQLRTLKRIARTEGVVLPSQKTLDKYGLTLREWLHHLDAQQWRCAICHLKSNTGKYVTDHEHVRGWVAMPDEERKRYVRGVICWMCNRYYLAKGISLLRARNVVQYLTDYEARRDNA